MAARIHNRSVGRLIFSAGLRKDGERTFSVASDIREGGPVVGVVITPWLAVMIFDRPRLDALAAQLEAAEAVR